MLSTAQRSTASAASSEKSDGTGVPIFYLLLPIGILALGHALIYNYSCDNFPVTFVYDSEFYRQTCSMFVHNLRLLSLGVTQILEHHRFEHLFFIGGLLPHFSQFVEFVGHVRVDGPVLPVLYAIPCLLTGKDFSVLDWRIVVVLQSFLYAGSVMFTGAIGARLSGNKKVGILSAALYGLYPPACLVTNRFLTETLAVFLSTALLTLICSSFGNKSTSPWKQLLIGVIAGLAFMLRPAMALSLALPILCSVVSEKRWPQAIGTAGRVFVGAFFTILPWTVFSTIFLGRPLITPDREPGLNLALGFDIESGGNAVIYMSPFARLTYDPQGPWQAAVGLLHARPAEYIKFLLWKLEKMALFPWNDFHHSLMGISPSNQFFIHVALMGLSLLGIICASFAYRNQSENQKATFCTCLFFVLGCLPVLLFVTVNRYLFPATPLMAVFAACGLFYLAQRPHRAIVPIAACWLAISGAYAISYQWLSPESREKKLELTSGSALVRKVDIGTLPKASSLDTAIFIVDGDNLTSDSKVFVNGKLVPGTFAPLYYFDSDSYSIIALDELSTNGKRTNVPCIENMRIWRGISVPASFLVSGNNEFKLMQTAGSCTVYSDREKTERRLPSLFLFSDDIFWQNPSRLDGRPDEPILSAGNASHETFTVENNGSRTGPSARPRMRLVFAKRDPLCPASKSDAEEIPAPLSALNTRSGAIGTPQSGVPGATATKASPSAPLVAKLPNLRFAPNPEGLTRGSLVVDGTNRSAEYIEKFSPMVGPYHWVEVRGRVRAIKSNSSRPSILTTIQFSDSNAAIEVPSQSRLEVSKHWAPFCTTGLIAHNRHPSVSAAIIDVNAEDIKLLRERGPRPQKCGSFEFSDLELRIVPVSIPKCSFKQRIII